MPSITGPDQVGPRVAQVDAREARRGCAGLGSCELPPARLGLNSSRFAPTGERGRQLGHHLVGVAAARSAPRPGATSRIQRKELPPEKMLTAEVNSPGTTCVNT